MNHHVQLQLLFVYRPAHLPKDASTHSGLGTPLTCPQTNLMEAIFNYGGNFPFPFQVGQVVN